MVSFRCIAFLAAVILPLTRGASLYRRGDTGDEGVDTTLRLGSGPASFLPSQQRSDAGSTTRDFSPSSPLSRPLTVAPLPQLDLETQLHPHLISQSQWHPQQQAESSSWKSVPIRNLPPKHAEPSLPTQQKAGATLENPVVLESSQEDQSSSSRPTPRRYASSGKQATMTMQKTVQKGKRRSRWMLFDSTGTIMAQSGHGPGDVRGPGMTKFPASGVLHLQAALQSRSPEPVVYPEDYQKLLKEYRQKHLARYLPPVVDEHSNFHPENADLLNNRIKELLKMRAIMLHHAETGGEVNRIDLADLRKASFRDWSMMSSVASKRGLYVRAHPSVRLAYLEDWNTVRTLELILGKLAPRFKFA